MRRAFLVAVLALFTACAAHEKTGDRASSTGDWKTAEREYARALHGDPGKPELQAKYREARANALAQARRAAQACAAGQDWECVFSESQYALDLDPGDAQMATLRHDAAREVGRLRLRRAAEALDRGETARAMGLIENARAATDDAGVEAEARALSRRAVQAASRDAERYRISAQYQPAIDLLSQAARLDPGVTPQLRSIQAEYERWKDGEAERLAREGDALVDAGRFADARARYQQAMAIRPTSRARDFYRYTDSMVEGERQVANRQFPAAETAFRQALETGLDRGAATAALDRVQVRRYAVRLLGVRVRRGGPPGDLVVSVTLPDGRQLQTPPEHGSWARLESAFVVAANSYDDRKVTARVLRLVERPGDPPFELGTMSFRVSDLLARRTLALSDGAVDELRVDVVPTDRGVDEVRGLEPPYQPAPPPPPQPRPERRS